MLRSGVWTVMAALALGACGGGGSSSAGSTDPGEAAAQYAGPIGSTDVARGEEMYNSVCESCHSGGAPGLAGINWEPAAMRQRIREGGGRMPAITESRLSANDMEAILAYMVTIQGVTGSAGGEAPDESEGDEAAE